MAKYEQMTQFAGGNSSTFILLKKLRLVGNEEKYGRINPFSFVWIVAKNLYRRLLFNFAYKAYILEPLYKKNVRPAIWRELGCKVGKNVLIGHQVRVDFGNAERIVIDDDAVLSNGVTLLCHRRDVRSYRIGMKANALPFKYEDIHLGKGCQIGLNATIMPGVTIGEGAIIGSCSLVSKDVPAWSIAVGVPAHVVRLLKPDN